MSFFDFNGVSDWNMMQQPMQQQGGFTPLAPNAPMQNPYGGSQLPGTQTPDLGNFEFPTGGLPEPLPAKFDSSSFQTAGLNAPQIPSTQSNDMFNLAGLARARSGQEPYERFMGGANFPQLPTGLLGA